jgi:glycosyltransferase involved in cell wall biosynthesis
LKKFDKIFAFNNKELKLRTNNGINESLIKVIIPYFKNISFTDDKKNLILFYGSMGRKLNYLAAIWFIENVFYLLNNDFIFVILGSNPHPDLLKYKSERIIITGYQTDVKSYFEKALCLVAPLERGAGIKVKVLKALSAGIPVLGTEVAREGIDVSDAYALCGKSD